MQSNVFVGIKPQSSNSSTGGAETSTLPFESYDYTLLPITNSRYRDLVRQEFENYKISKFSNKMAELEISEPQLQDVCVPPFKVHNNDGNTPSYIGLLSSWLELDSNDNSIRQFSYKVLLNECRYARFVGINKLILAPPRDLANMQQYSQTIAKLLHNEVLTTSPSITLSISLPLCEDSDPLATWELWNTVRKICNYHPALTISLAVPRIRTPSYVLQRWLSEPVSCLLLSSSIFSTNQHNYPVLHKFNQHLIHRFQRVNGNSQVNSNDLCIILHGMEKYVDHIKGGETSYLEYINYLLKKEDKLIISENGEPSSPMLAENGWIPKLMPPLKPNSDNLTNTVYSVFENDTAKYELYHNAIQEAIQDRLSTIRIHTSFTILIAGAGRGPLVDRVFHIVKYFNVLNNVKIIALEKNPQAFLYLQKRKFDNWGKYVELVKEDMKIWENFEVKADIVISELLGSFGCNELSPECLINIELNHSKRNTTFIPQSYSSYIAPISVPLLYQKLRDIPNGFEKPWVLHNIPYCILSTKINETWSFEHGKHHSYNYFNKSVISEFKIKYKGEVHGLIGFFTAKLYGETVLSTIPDHCLVKMLPGNSSDCKDSDAIHNLVKKSHETSRNVTTSSSELVKRLNSTQTMRSWSPIVFPVKDFSNITDDTELSVFINRFNSKETGKVWYEWSMESFVYLVVSSPTSNSKKLANKRGKNRIMNPDLSMKQRSMAHTSYTDKSKDPCFINSTNEDENSGFGDQQEMAWESINDIHGLTGKNSHCDLPMFNLNTGQRLSVIPNDEQDEDNSDIELEEELDDEASEIHIRIKMGVTSLHNVNGHVFNIPV